MDVETQPMVSVKAISKAFRLPHEQHNGVKQLIINLAKNNRGYEVQQVLHDINFDIRKGEFYGIVGRNGSGKSTLLKLLAGIYTPDSGAIQVNGSLTPFIELGVGFNPELTGRENIFLNGALLGFSRDEMATMYNSIVEFAELEKFMDQKLKNYSSGMQVRLAFSIAVRAQSEVLIFDEVLAVGDSAFQQKCYDMFASLKEKGVTIILVTHDMSAVLRFCDKALMLDQGIIKKIGTPKEIADAYLERNFNSSSTKNGSKTLEQLGKVDSLELKTPENIHTNDTIQLTLNYVNKGKEPIHFGFQIFNEQGVYCFGTNTKLLSLQPQSNDHGSIDIQIEANLVPGTYSITVATMSKNATKVIDYRPSLAFFRVKTDDQAAEGVVPLRIRWTNK